MNLPSMPSLLLFPAVIALVTIASCTLLAPTGTNTAPDAFPTPDANGVVLILHQRVDVAAKDFLFQIETAADAPGTPPAPVSVESTEGDVEASFNVRNLDLEPGVHRVQVFEGTSDLAAAERVFVVPVPASDAGATPSSN